MSGAANPSRGEAALAAGGELLRLRPSFEALVAAEEELGPLFAVVERAAGGGLRIAEITALFWHCAHARPEGLTREAVGAAIVERGLAGVTPVLKVLLGQILQGASAGPP
ncbi:MAG TPA: gene transfer agent family protein [Allosphingosinicella sp.]|nr:gene transfer agent family protein [Allosphingosinicella sp.]